MNGIAITVTVPEQIVEDARSFGLLEDEAIVQLIQAEIKRREEAEEAKWEAGFESEDFAEAFAEDGKVDFKKLRALGQVMTLEDFKPD